MALGLAGQEFTALEKKGHSIQTSVCVGGEGGS